MASAAKSYRKRRAEWPSVDGGWRISLKFNPAARNRPATIRMSANGGQPQDVMTVKVYAGGRLRILGNPQRRGNRCLPLAFNSLKFL